MKIIEPYVEVDRIDQEAMLRAIEFRGRRCYKSEDKITKSSAAAFVRGIVKSGHHSVIEHEKISVNFVVDRGVSHELVRHRIAAFSQESTRYCNYGKQDEITLIRPFWVNVTEDSGMRHFDNNASMYWFRACECCEQRYLELIKYGWTPQQARSVLPNSLKTEVETTFNLREWRHFFSVRAQAAAHPQMQQVAIPLLQVFKNSLPSIFGDIPYNENFDSQNYAEIRFRDLKD